MLDLGWPELFVIVLVALVVLGPKELPGAIRTVTGLVRRARGLAREFHKSIDEMAKETGLDEVKRDIKKAVNAELDDDGLLGDPFAEADKNSILNPTNGSELPSPKGQPKPQTKPAKAKTNGGVAKSEVADKPTAGAKPKSTEPTPIAAPKIAEAEPASAPKAAQEVAKEDGRA